MKLKALAILTVGMFAAATSFAGEGKACCAHGKVAGEKMNCSATFAKLDLTTDQKTQMEKLAADCEKGGCNEQTMAKMEQGARKVLNDQQFAQWKAACAGHSHGDKKTTS